MGKVSFNISMSLDGYINRPVTPEQGLGRGGERLHGGPSTATDATARCSAFGARPRRDHRQAAADLSIPWWGADGPAGGLRVPVFVVTPRLPTTCRTAASTPS